jgi:hypothetical protein
MTRATDAAEQADWDRAPNILEGATEVELSPYDCDVEFWLVSVAQGSLAGLVRGRRPESTVPDFLRRPGPLRDSLIAEFAFRSLSEEAATKACALVTSAARNVVELEFYSTQTLDEARHAQVFRDHLLDLGIPRNEVVATIERAAGEDRDRVLEPLWGWGLPAFANDFINGVVIVTILLEGVLAPTTELSERRWKPLSPATTDIERGACVDEIRHLAVGSWFVRQHLIENPDERDRIVALIAEGRAFWDALPTSEVLYRREMLFQRGLEECEDAVGDYEIFPGRRLLDTSPEERLLMAMEWSRKVQESRLAYMGLSDPDPAQADPEQAAPDATAAPDPKRA